MTIVFQLHDKFNRVSYGLFYRREVAEGVREALREHFPYPSRVYERSEVRPVTIYSTTNEWVQDVTLVEMDGSATFKAHHLTPLEAQ